MEDYIFLKYKPKGITSFSFINNIKKENNLKKIGHAGTLDPDAEGLMIVMVNDATKFSNLLMDHNKEYYVTLELGYETDTLDISGTITKKYDGKILIDNNKIIETINSFKGSIMQVPPMYSAIKKNGIKLYELARKNIDMMPEARRVIIEKISDIKIIGREISFRVSVSKGTYIRSLVRDIGIKLNYYATMKKLVREKINFFSLEDIDKKIYLEDIVKFPKLNVNSKEYIFLKNGMTQIFYNLNIDEKKLKIYYDKKFVGIVDVINVVKNKYYLKRSFYFK